MPPSYSTSQTPTLSRRLSQWICGLHGHDTQLQIGADRLLLRCKDCGYATPGWVVRRPATWTSPGERPRQSATSSAPAAQPAQ